MIDQVLGVAQGLLPIKPLGIVRQLTSELTGQKPAGSRAQEAVEARMSSFAQQLQEMVASGQIKSLSDDSLNQLSGAYEANVSAFNDMLGKIFGARGIDTSQPMTIGVDDHNRFEVTNGHPQADDIETLLNRHPALIVPFQRLAAQSQFLDMAQRQSGFVDVAATGDYRQIAQYRAQAEPRGDLRDYQVTVQFDA